MNVNACIALSLLRKFAKRKNSFARWEKRRDCTQNLFAGGK
jgi:hypothetical protein